MIIALTCEIKKLITYLYKYFYINQIDPIVFNIIIMLFKNKIIYLARFVFVKTCKI